MFKWIKNKRHKTLKNGNEDCVFEEKQIYNLEKQFIGNILFYLVSKDKDILKSEGMVETVQKKVIDFLSNFLDRKLDVPSENEKIKVYVEQYLKNLEVDPKAVSVGLVEVNTKPFVDLEKENSK